MKHGLACRAECLVRIIVIASALARVRSRIRDSIICVVTGGRVYSSTTERPIDAIERVPLDAHRVISEPPKDSAVHEPKRRCPGQGLQAGRHSRLSVLCSTGWSAWPI